MCIQKDHEQYTAIYLATQVCRNATGLHEINRTIQASYVVQYIGVGRRGDAAIQLSGWWWWGGGGGGREGERGVCMPYKKACCVDRDVKAFTYVQHREGNT